VISATQQKQMDMLRESVTSAGDEIRALKAMLKELEWASGSLVHYCLVCRGIQGQEDHAPECQLDALLRTETTVSE